MWPKQRCRGPTGLSMLARGIGDRQVRNCGTIGGSLANNDPAACYPSAVLALSGTIHTNKRDIAAHEFFTGMFETVLDDDEIITAVTLPNPLKSAYVKFPNPASRYAMVGVFVAKFPNGVQVAVTGAGEDGVFRAKDIEAALSDNFDAASLDGVTMSEDGLIEDLHAHRPPGTSDFRNGTSRCCRLLLASNTETISWVSQLLNFTS